MRKSLKLMMDKWTPLTRMVMRRGWETELNHGLGLHEIRFGEAHASEA